MRRWIVKLLMLTGLLILSGCSIEGTVVDESGSAVENVQVTAVYSGVSKTTTTDADGAYFIKGLKRSGDITVTITKDGFVEQSDTTSLSRSGAVLDFTFVKDEVIETPSVGTVNGTVHDIAGKPLENVVVSSGMVTATTDVAGRYSLSLEAGEKVSVTVSLKNYAQQSRNTAVVADTNSTLDLTMVQVDKIVTFDVSEGATLLTKGASVALDASSIVNMDGSEYTGDVVAKMTFNQVTSTVGRDTFPGDYIGLQTNGEESVLQSYGFIDVTLEDSSGNKLRLADGTTARLTYPMDDNIETTPATIPLWYYDIEQGIWVEDGVATYDGDTNTYSGDVTHFTTWNLDAKVVRATYKSCVEDANGMRIPDAQIYLTTSGWNRNFINNDATGEFGFRNAPSGLSMSVRAKSGLFISEEKTFVLDGGEVRVDNDCLKVNIDASDLYFSILGKVIYSGGSAVENASISIYGDGKYIGSARTDVDGVYHSTDFIRGTYKTVTLKFNVYINGNYLYYENSYIIDENNAVTNVGTYEVKATTVVGCLQKADGSRDFTSRGGYINLDHAFSNWIASIDTQGNFSFAVNQDNATHSAYAFAEQSTLTKKFDFTASADNIDMSSSCIVLDETIDINTTVDAAVTSSNPDVYLKVVFGTYGDYSYVDVWGEETLLGGENCYETDGNATSDGVWVCEDMPKETTGTFEMHKNGVYYMYQVKDDWAYIPFDGTFSFTIDGVVNSLSIPTGVDSANAWVGHVIEVYQGDIKIIELNKEADYGS